CIPWTASPSGTARSWVDEPGAPDGSRVEEESSEDEHAVVAISAATSTDVPSRPTSCYLLRSIPGRVSHQTPTLARSVRGRRCGDGGRRGRGCSRQPALRCPRRGPAACATTYGSHGRRGR